MFFDQSKNNRNHGKLKVDFHCCVILRTSMGVNKIGLCLQKLRVQPHSTFSADASHPYIFSVYFLFCFILDAVFMCIETNEMHV